jgi:hypothetical protein
VQKFGRYSMVRSPDIKVTWSPLFTDDRQHTMADPNPTKVAGDCTMLGISRCASGVVILT